MRNRLVVAFALTLIVGVLPATTSAEVLDTDVTYTTDTDFDLGTLVSVNHDTPSNDQLQLDSPTEPFPFINVAASGRGTVVRVNTDTGNIVGEYRTAPEGRGLNPSRTTVDLFGNVWTANREEVGEIEAVAHGSAVKVGLIVGGSRVDATGAADPAGEYLAPPFGYNTCSDRDEDGLIRTSAGLETVLDWPDVTDGLGGADGLVTDALDECILIYQRLPDAEQARHVSVDADNNVWVGGFPFDGRMFHKVSGLTGAILDSFDAREFGCGGYGGLVDGNGVLWSIGWGSSEGSLLRYDPATRTGMCVNTHGGYGLGIDTNGYLWASIWENGIAKVSPDGVLQPGFPKSTWSASTTNAAEAVFSPMVGREPLQALPAMAMALQAETASFQLSPADDWVQSQNPWLPNATISLTIEDGSGVVYSDSQIAGGFGHFNFNLWDLFDIERGHLVTVSDGTTTKTHTVIDLYVDSVDLVNDDIIGRADAGASVDVWVDGYDGMTVTADGSGNWTADFSGTANITELSIGASQQSDDDGDSTQVWWGYPSFQVAPTDDWVQSRNPWVPGATISLTIEDGSGVVYTDSQEAGGNGHFNFGDLGEFDLQRGHLVTVSDGTTTKTHTVTNLFVDGVDVTADTVSGRADAGSSVEVWAHGEGNVTVTADVADTWVADFSAITDLTYLSDGGSQQTDTDGDSTGVWWSAPRFQVAPGGDWVQSQSPWPAGATISLSIADDSGVVYTDSQVADSGGNFNFNLWDVFDVERGHVVTVSDGTTTKVHTVMDLFVDGVDVTADTVSGRADAGSSVEVWVHDAGNVTVTADGTDTWVADFSAITDLTYLSDGGSQQMDVDGDSTGVWWSSPRFQANPDRNWVEAISSWPVGVAITLTIDDGEAGYTATQTTGSDGHFHFGLAEEFELQRGHHVTVSDGTTTKTHTVIDLYADAVDVDDDTVSGRGEAGIQVNAWIHGEGVHVSTTADSAGDWTADFSAIADVTYVTEGGAEQSDADGDSTGVEWFSPRFQVNPDDETVGNWGYWTPGTAIDLTIGAYSDSTTTDQNGEFWFDLQGTVDIERGQQVSVTDGTTTKTHVVKDLFVTDVDLVADTISGTAASGSNVEVQVHEPWDAWRVVTADGSGDWTADFSTLTGEGDGLADLNVFTSLSANESDEQGDVTSVPFRPAVFQVSPESEGLWGSGWEPDTALAISIDDGNPVTDIYTTTFTTDMRGDLNGNIWDYDIVTGDLITISDGTHTKVHTVTAVTVPATGIDVTADTIKGSAEPNAWVQVNASLFQEGASRWVQANGSGNWIADFSVPSNSQPVFDVTDMTFINVEEYDDDGDTTYRQFGPPVQANRGVAVTPIDNHVWVANSGVGSVSRLDNDGNVLEVIETGNQPTGVAVDAAGKVWVTNLGSNNTVRIDPNGGSDLLGAVDLTVDLGEAASPYNYSDMTGAVVVGSTSPQGFWTVVQDSGEEGFEWGRLTWNSEPEGEEPEGTEIVVEIRTSDSEAGLGAETFVPVPNGELFSSFGRYIEVRVTLKASSGGLSPVLSDIRVQPAAIAVPLDIKPRSCPNPFNVGNNGVMPVAILGTDDLAVRDIDPSSIRLEGVAPLRWAYQDVATPFEPYLGKTGISDCTRDGRDGYTDLTLKFSAQALAAALGHVLNRDVLVLTMTGFLMDGTPIVGEDVIIVIKKK